LALDARGSSGNFLIAGMGCGNALDFCAKGAQCPLRRRCRCLALNGLETGECAFACFAAAQFVFNGTQRGGDLGITGILKVDGAEGGGCFR
jgi:hypothetical protein